VREAIRLQGDLGGGQPIDTVIDAMVSNTDAQLVMTHRDIVKIDRERRPIITAAGAAKGPVIHRQEHEK